MSANVYEAQPMEVDDEVVLLVLSLKWIKTGDEQQKVKRLETSLAKMLQSWFNKREPKVDCSVKRTLKDGRVVVKIKPAPALTDLQKLSKQTLTGKDGNSVTITSISLTLPSLELDTQVPEDSSINLPASLHESQMEQVQKGEQSNVLREEVHSCSVPVGHFWYVNHMYEEEMKRIEKKNGVKIKADVKVRFEVDQKHGRSDDALDEFANLVQKSLVESSGSVIPLKFIDPDQWGDALKTIQKKENKLLVTLTSETMTVRGPPHSQEAISKFLNADTQQKRNTDASHEEYERETQDTSLKIDMTTKDSLMDTGLTMEESYWKVMITSYSEKDEDEAYIVLSLKWIKTGDEPQQVKRLETSLEKMLQSWFNKCKHKVDCSVKTTLKDGRVVIKTKPAPALTDLQTLDKQTLTGKDGNSVTITSISLTLPSPELDTQVPEDASMTLPPSVPDPQTDQVQLGEQSKARSAGGEQIGAPEDASTNHPPFVPAPQTVCTV